MNLFENWNETKQVLLEGLSPEKQEIVAPLLENQKNYILTEDAVAGSTAAHNIANVRKVMLPMIRRIIPGTIATELVGVQPMTGPVGLVYTLRYRYAEAVTGTPANNPFGAPHNTAVNDEMFGNATPIRHFYSSHGNIADLSEPAGASGLDVPAVANLIATGATGHAWPSSLPAYDTSTFGPFGPDAIGITHSGTLHGGSGSVIEGSGGRKATLDIVNMSVEAGTRALQAGWTIQAMQDMQSQHNLNVETEMTSAMSAEIVHEIDYEIISDLVALAGTVETFNGAGAGPYGAGAGNYTPTFIGDRLANLGVFVNRVANEIAAKTRRGAGNWIVVSPMIVSVLQSAAKSVFAPAIAGSFKGPNNSMLVGTLNGTIKVYSFLWNQAGRGIDLGNALPAAVDDTILVGYKGGNGETDAGYFYCPYIPLMSSGTVIHPVTFQPVVSLMTRYGRCAFTNTNTSLGNSADYYGKINVVDLDLL